MKNAIKKLALNLHEDMKKINVITIQTVELYGMSLKENTILIKQSLPFFHFLDIFPFKSV